MSNKFALVSIGVGMACLVGAILYQKNITGYSQEYAAVQDDNVSGVARIEYSLNVTSDVLSEIASHLESIRDIKTNIAIQTEKLAELQSGVDPDLEQRKLQAMNLAAEVIESKRLEKFTSAKHFIEERLASRDSDNAVTEYITEARYGPLLQELGIEGERYETILLELSKLQVENNDNMAAYRGGALSEGEARSLFSQNNADSALRSLLSAEEFNAFQLERLKSNSQSAENAIYARVLQLTPSMSIPSRELLATTYNRVRETPPPEYYSDDKRLSSALETKYSYMVDEALPALAEMYEATLEGAELEEAMRFVKAAEIENRKYLELIDAGIITSTEDCVNCNL